MPITREFINGELCKKRPYLLVHLIDEHTKKQLKPYLNNMEMRIPLNRAVPQPKDALRMLICLEVTYLNVPLNDENLSGKRIKDAS